MSAPEEPSWWDSIPRLEFRWGHRFFPAWTTMGRLGALAGIALFGYLGVKLQLPTPVIVLVVAANVASFLAWRFVGRRWRRGRYILLEHAALAAATTVGASALFLVPARIVLGAWAPAMALTIAFGRLGCLFHGCCHGQPSLWGPRYRWLWPAVTGGRWAGVRYLPTQLIEGAVLAALAVAGSALALGNPGTAAATIPVAYAVARFELERWRGDDRAYYGPLSHSQWLSVGVLVVVATTGATAIGLAGIGATSLLFILRLRRLVPPPFISAPAGLEMLERAANEALAGRQAFAGAVAFIPKGPDGPDGVHVRVAPGHSALSRAAAAALTRVLNP
ncbi:MAG TPA: prolipoprotein diacylglyceryl transferase family protein [Kofleriaceae bacterium]|jgi:prolipoprotein diacylglyceryltransferase|nr:prolipoprotein diacylglyceryl transferase family protein [Kofleriaceae bacterium]